MAEPSPDTREQLIRNLERLTGRTLKTREDIAAYVREAAARRASDVPSVQRWLKAKKVTLIALFAFSVIQYHILDVMLEIVSMPSTTFFVPASTRTLKS